MAGGVQAFGIPQRSPGLTSDSILWAGRGISIARGLLKKCLTFWQEAVFSGIQTLSPKQAWSSGLGLGAV